MAAPRDRWHELDDAIEDSNLRASYKAVFRRRLKRADYRTAELPAQFTESQPVVARKTSLTVRQVRRSERHLELHDWLTITGTTGRGHTPRYEFSVGSQCDCTGRVHQRVKADTDQEDTAVKADTATAKGGHNSPERRTPNALKADTEGGHAAGQRPVCTESQKRGNEREVEERHVNEQEQRLTEADILAMTPARRCDLCGAARDDEAGFIRHEPDCWHEQAMTLLGRE